MPPPDEPPDESPDEPPGMPPPDEPPPGSWIPPPLEPLLPPLMLTDAHPVTNTAEATMAMQALGNAVRNPLG